MKDKIVCPLVIYIPEILEEGSVEPALLSVARGIPTPFTDMLIEVNYSNN